jgi:hypothetical protein
MATSNSTNFATSRDNLIKGALRLVGGIGQGETPTTDQTSEAADTLNMMIKGFMGYGMPLWAVKRTNVTLVAATKSYSIGLSATVNTPKPLKIYQAYRHNNTTNIDVPLQIVSRQEYEQLSGKTSSGPPNQVYYEPLLSTGTLYVYPAPDSSTATNEVITIVYQRPFEDFDAAGDEPDFPQEWYEVIKYGLAVRLAGEYGLERFSRKALKDEFEKLLELAQGFNQEEVSIYFSPDQRQSLGWK